MAESHHFDAETLKFIAPEWQKYLTQTAVYHPGVATDPASYTTIDLSLKVPISALVFSQLKDQEDLAAKLEANRQKGAAIVTPAKNRGGLDVFWSPTPIVGYRVFQWKKNGVCGVWREDWGSPTMEAVCLPNRGRPTRHIRMPSSLHPAPDPGCRCGIYADKIRANDPHQIATPGHLNGVSAIVQLSGTVIEHENGYRAEKATVVELMARSLGHADGVLSYVFHLDDPEEIEAFFADPWPFVGRPRQHPLAYYFGVRRRWRETYSRQEG